MIQETKTKWNSVYNIFQKDEGKNRLKFGEEKSAWFYKTPKKLISYLAYYKFAAKMIGPDKKVLDIGCDEGIGSYLIAQECGGCCGIDLNEEAINLAKTNYNSPAVEFCVTDCIDEKRWDAIVQLGLQMQSYENVAHALQKDGTAIFGVSILQDDFEQQLQKYFGFVFPFCASGEIVHTGFDPKAHYFIALCCGPR